MAKLHDSSQMIPFGKDERTLRWTMLTLFAAVLLSSGIFLITRGNPLCLAPLALFASWRFLPMLGEQADQKIFLGFLILCFVVDDLSQTVWGRDVEPFTEQLGIILFKSFGLTGMELFAILMSIWLVVARSRMQVLHWIRCGLPRLLMVTSSILVCSSLAGIYGLANGSSFNTLFIQMRFLYIFCVWSFIGFVVLRDFIFVRKVILYITVLMTLKSMQAIYLYRMNLDIFKESEYLIEHYIAPFSVIALLGLGFYAIRTRRPLLWLLQGISFAAVAVAYVLNDRRTSYVAIGLATLMLPFLMPRNWIRRHFPKLILIGAIGVLYVGGTWNLPAPIGFVGATVQSFGKETGESGPSYRDLENANLFEEVAAHPFTGIGLGNEFEETYRLPFIALVYPRYRMIPHNTYIASWAFGGPLTITALSLVFVTMIWLAGRLMRSSTQLEDWFVGFIFLYFAVQYFAFTFGDIGLQVGRLLAFGGLFVGSSYRLLSEKSFKGGV